MSIWDKHIDPGVLDAMVAAAEAAPQRCRIQQPESTETCRTCRWVWRVPSTGSFICCGRTTGQPPPNVTIDMPCNCGQYGKSTVPEPWKSTVAV